tara:strand:+ start:7571 stop:9469 length:1899 start_codon:yes stop_codon:yes gene_type:complete
MPSNEDLDRLERDLARYPDLKDMSSLKRMSPLESLGETAARVKEYGFSTGAPLYSTNEELFHEINRRLNATSSDNPIIGREWRNQVPENFEEQVRHLFEQGYNFPVSRGVGQVEFNNENLGFDAELDNKSYFFDSPPEPSLGRHVDGSEDFIGRIANKFTSTGPNKVPIPLLLRTDPSSMLAVTDAEANDYDLISRQANDSGLILDDELRHIQSAPDAELQNKWAREVLLDNGVNYLAYPNTVETGYTSAGDYRPKIRQFVQAASEANDYALSRMPIDERRATGAINHITNPSGAVLDVKDIKRLFPGRGKVKALGAGMGGLAALRAEKAQAAEDVSGTGVTWEEALDKDAAREILDDLSPWDIPKLSISNKGEFTDNIEDVSLRPQYKQGMLNKPGLVDSIEDLVLQPSYEYSEMKEAPYSGYFRDRGIDQAINSTRTGRNPITEWAQDVAGATPMELLGELSDLFVEKPITRLGESITSRSMDPISKWAMDEFPMDFAFFAGKPIRAVAPLARRSLLKSNLLELPKHRKVSNMDDVVLNDDAERIAAESGQGWRDRVDSAKRGFEDWRLGEAGADGTAIVPRRPVRGFKMDAALKGSKRKAVLEKIKLSKNRLAEEIKRRRRGRGFKRSP